MNILTAIYGTKKNPSGQIILLDKSDFATALKNNNANPIDVRTAPEFQNGHLRNAINLDISNVRNFEKSMQTLDKTEAVFVYCRSGARSHKAALRLLKMGFLNVYDLQGGYIAWFD